ncbi:MAG TPA: EAL domain-containing protein [Terriglobales bacterium]|nr:EAL domain-containing protein [Terriglobales bacterium]
MRFVARQPILDRLEHTFGYELLFRAGLEATFRSTDHDLASRTTIDTSLLMGVDVLCDQGRAFVNCTRDVLIKDYLLLLPAQRTVAEILESIDPDEQVSNACQRLKRAGYLIALDDFVPSGTHESLVPFADIIKLDLRVLDAAQCRRAVVQYQTSGCRMLAEKVETHEEFRAARQMGFDLFQGFFFERPQILTSHEVPTLKLNYLRMLQAVHKTTLNYGELERFIKAEASLCYRLLRYLNSAAFAFTAEIRGVRHALAMLGERQIRRWFSLVAFVGAGQDKSRELVIAALVRGRFCESLASHFPGKSDLFLLGLFSLMDALLDLPMWEVLTKVPVAAEIKNALLRRDPQDKLARLLDLIAALESGKWDEFSRICSLLRLDESRVSEFYFTSLEHVEQITREFELC